MRTLALALCLVGCTKAAPAPAARARSAPVAAPVAPVAAATPLVTLDGKQVDLAAYRKKVTVVVLWATWCNPCMAELPMVQALQLKVASDPDVAIVAVNADDVTEPADLARIANVAKKLGLTMPVLLDGTKELERRLSVPDGVAAPTNDWSSSLPMTAVFLREHYSREEGFDETLDTNGYVTKKLAMLKDAKAGTLPREQTE